MPQLFVGYLGAALRIAQRNFARSAPRLRSMKNRFPSECRVTWRERFVAIARQADTAGRITAPELDLPRPRVRSLASKVAIRVRFAAITTH